MAAGITAGTWSDDHEGATGKDMPVQSSAASANRAESAAGLAAQALDGLRGRLVGGQEDDQFLRVCAAAPAALAATAARGEHIARDLGVGEVDDLDLAWVLGNPVVAAPIVGATSPQHLDGAVAALDVRLTEEENRTLEAPYTPRQPTGF